MPNKGKVYTLKEYAKILTEKKNTYVKMGDNVETEDKKNNERAVNDILKQCGEYDGGHLSIKENDITPQQDFNRTPIDVDFAEEPSQEYKDRVKSQVHGYPSSYNEKNSNISKDNDSLEFDVNKKIYKNSKDKKEKMSDYKQTIKRSGLSSRTMPKETFKNNDIFKNESKKMKRLHFSKSIFVNESEMIKKIPDDMKVHGNKFYMKDSIGNEYLVECKRDDVVSDYIHTNVIFYENKQKMNEAFDRMKKLYNYNSSDTNCSDKTVNENEILSKMISESKAKLINEEAKKVKNVDDLFR